MAAIADAPTLADPDDAPVPHVTHDPETGCAYPAPTTPEPNFVTLAHQLIDACAEATDGCFPLESDGVCKLGHPTWLRRLGIVCPLSRRTDLRTCAARQRSISAALSACGPSSR